MRIPNLPAGKMEIPVNRDRSHVAPHSRMGVERECPDPDQHTYRLAFFRFAQDAFSRLDIAFLAAALIGARFRFCVVVV